MVCAIEEEDKSKSKSNGKNNGKNKGLGRVKLDGFDQLGTDR
jgi:hypothetical protein